MIQPVGSIDFISTASSTISSRMGLRPMALSSVVTGQRCCGHDSRQFCLACAFLRRWICAASWPVFEFLWYWRTRWNGFRCRGRYLRCAFDSRNDIRTSGKWRPGEEIRSSKGTGTTNLLEKDQVYCILWRARQGLS